MVRVVSHLRREIEGDAQTVDALAEQVLVSAVGLARRAKPGVLTHRPQAAAIHRRLNAASERKFAGEAQIARQLRLDCSASDGSRNRYCFSRNGLEAIRYTGAVSHAAPDVRGAVASAQ